MKPPPTATPFVYWGLWDNRDKSWLGDEHGPHWYAVHLHARAAATIVTEMFRRRLVVPRIIPREAWVHKGTVEARFTGEEAIRRIEGKAQ